MFSAPGELHAEHMRIANARCLMSSISINEKLRPYRRTVKTAERFRAQRREFAP
jgi:hypothetical protein